MSHRFRISMMMLTVGIALVSLAAVCAAGQARPSTLAAPAAQIWTQPKTPWGDPDLQGIYTSDDLIGTPLQRPTELGERLYRTEEELARIETQIARRAEVDLQESVAPDTRIGTGPPSHWGERARKPSRQTSLIVDPPDGRIPPLTSEGQRRQKAVAARQGAPPASWEDFSYFIRCITRGLTGSILPAGYGNGTQIVQAPGYVAILHEMVHEARIIPLDKRPHVGQSIRTYMGDSRGHWEGQTLVVETANFPDNKTGIGAGGGVTPTSDALRLVERFTRVDPNTIRYEVAIEDPKIYTKPWKVAFPITQEPGYELFEYTCHETNYAMTNSLSGARVEEKAAEAAKQK